MSMSTTATANTYVFDQAWQKELGRLRSLEELFDPASQRHLAALGVGPGWRCLEVGCGAGSVARWLTAALIEAGLEDVSAEVHAPVVRGATPSGWVPLSVEHLRPRLVADGLLTEAEVEHCLRLMADPSARYLPPFMITAWGRRGRASS